MRIVSWNVNSLRVRLDHLVSFLGTSHPDVVCLQETKVTDELFPEELIADAGYRAVFSGQKTYNGVALLVRSGLSIENVKRRLDGDDADEQKRFISASIEGVQVLDCYVPNGQEVGSPAFAYKLSWLRRLRAELDAHHSPEEPLIVCGDFNVAPTPLDVHDPKRWKGKVLCHPDERAALQQVLDFGLSDLVRELHPEEAGLFSWWDYRLAAFQRKWGLRIDLALGTRVLREGCSAAFVDLEPRRLEKPSDHAPVVVDVELS